MPVKAFRICIYGIVQGVGFRPFASRLAAAHGIKGTAANKGSYVEIYAEGDSCALDTFIKKLRAEAPARSLILLVTSTEIEPQGFSDFKIIESGREKGNIFVSPDIATCPECRKELYDPGNRRFMHSFINCTACGPRLTILDAMPYDRERTSMKEFPMCPQCAEEYFDPADRRYDAQPVCCNNCGPEVYLIGSNIRGRDAISAARRAVRDGKIIAVKGIGGFHLCCNAKDEEAVNRLRKLKNRPTKPFAVMMKDYLTVERECDLSFYANDPAVEKTIRELLEGPQKPILLLRKSPDTHIAPSVAPDNPKTGVMLPYAPIQMLLFEYDDGIDINTDVLVMTSANSGGAPICRTDEEALSELSGVCDLMLSHNRKIRLRADDSVMDLYKGRPYMIRRSRGYAPLPVMIDDGMPGCVLGIGGELKNTFCIAKDGLYYLSPYIGDMEDIRSVNVLKESVERMGRLLEAKFTHVAADMHPGYNSSAAAAELGKKLIKVQHHYAHILSCMAENNYLHEVIGASFDGTGYGTDGTIWGGEILRCSPDGFERLACIAPFINIGGDAAVREGWRTAVSILGDFYGDDAAEKAEQFGCCTAKEADVLLKMKKASIGCVRSTSAGRLFDAVSAVLGIRRVSTFEGEAAVTLQFRAEQYLEKAGETEADELVRKHYNMLEDKASCRNGSAPGIIRTDLLFRYICEEYERSDRSFEEKCSLAYVFHGLLAKQTVKMILKASEDTGIRTAALSGGVFQNTLLLKLTQDELEEHGIKVLIHQLVPPNDGGIALGQAVFGMRNLKTAGSREK